jgi:hypothetical protein
LEQADLVTRRLADGRYRISANVTRTAARIGRGADDHPFSSDLSL